MVEIPNADFSTGHLLKVLRQSTNRVSTEAFVEKMVSKISEGFG